MRRRSREMQSTTQLKEKQLGALHALYANKMNPLTEEVRTSIIDCVSSEHIEVKAEAFNLLIKHPHLMQSGSFLESVSHAAFIELDNAEHPRVLSAALNYIIGLDDTNLLKSCKSDEGLNKNLLINDHINGNASLKGVAYKGVGTIFLRLWLLCDEGLEKHIPIESSSDERHQVEEINYAVLDFYTKVVNQITSLTSTIDDFCSIICEVIDLYQSYMWMYDIDDCTNSILGLMNLATSRKSTLSRNQAKASRLATLLKHIIPSLFSHPLMLMSHWKEEVPASSSLRHMISSIFNILLQEFPNDDAFMRSTLALVTTNGNSSFLAMPEESKLSSQISNTSSLDLVNIVVEWIDAFVLPSFVHSVTRTDCIAIVKEVLSLISSNLISSSRMETCEAVMNCLVDIFSRSDVMYGIEYDTLVVYLLLTFRQLHWNVASEYIRSVFIIISKTSSNTIKLRLMTELWSLLLGTNEMSGMNGYMDASILQTCLACEPIDLDILCRAYSFIGLSRVLVVAAEALVKESNTFDYLNCALTTLIKYESYFSSEFTTPAFDGAVLAYIKLLQTTLDAVSHHVITETFKDALADYLCNLLKTVETSPTLSSKIKASLVNVIATYIPVLQTMEPTKLDKLLHSLLINTRAAMLSTYEKKLLFTDLSFEGPGSLGGSMLTHDIISSRSSVLPMLMSLNSIESVVRVIFTAAHLNDYFALVSEFLCDKSYLAHGKITAVDDMIQSIIVVLKSKGIDANSSLQHIENVKIAAEVSKKNLDSQAPSVISSLATLPANNSIHSNEVTEITDSISADAKPPADPWGDGFGTSNSANDVAPVIGGEKLEASFANFAKDSSVGFVDNFAKANPPLLTTPSVTASVGDPWTDADPFASTQDTFSSPMPPTSMPSAASTAISPLNEHSGPLPPTAESSKTLSESFSMPSAASTATSPSNELSGLLPPTTPQIPQPTTESSKTQNASVLEVHQDSPVSALSLTPILENEREPIRVVASTTSATSPQPGILLAQLPGKQLFDMDALYRNSLETADASLICKVDDQTPAGAGVPAAYDLFSIADDVAKAHIKSSRPSGSEVPFSPSEIYSDDYCGWELVSGCTDVVGVFGSAHFHPEQCVCEVKVRLHNGSGFKLSSLLLSLSLSDGTAAATSASSLARISSTSEAIESLYANAYCDKVFYFELKHLCSVEVTIELAFDELFLAEFSDAYTLPSSQVQEKAQDDKNPQKFRATLQHKPLSLPPVAMLFPYGFGVQSVLTHWRVPRDAFEGHGLPLDVFEQLIGQLGESFSVSVAPSRLLKNITMNTTNFDMLSVVDAEMTTDYFDTHGQRLLDARARVKICKSSKFLRLYAWALQTAWEEECIVILSLTKRGSSSCGGVLEVRTRHAHTMTEFASSIPSLVKVFSRGLLEEEEKDKTGTTIIATGCGFDVGEL